jgi:hypothetical protein
MANPMVLFIFGQPGSGKTTAKDALGRVAGWPRRPVIACRQYDFVLQQAMAEWMWVKQAEAITQAQQSVYPIRVEYALPARYIRLENSDGKLLNFAVENKDFYFRTTEVLAEQVIAEITKRRRGALPDVTIELAVRDDLYSLVFAGPAMKELLKLIKSPLNPYFSNTYVLQVAASERKRQSNLQNRGGFAVTDRNYHLGPPEDIVRWFQQGAMDSIYLHRQFALMTGLPTILVHQDDHIGLPKYIEVCTQTFRALLS